jgi:hypothetical protein
MSDNDKREMLDRLKSYIRRYWLNNNKFPKLELIKERFDITGHQLTELLRLLEYDGFIDRNYCSYKLNVEEEIERKESKDWILMILRIIMVVIGVGAITLSVYYTGIWLLEFLNPFLAFLLSTIMVAFSVGAFEVILIFRENRQKLFIVPFAILWIIVLCFSMMSTVAGQYNQRMKKQIIDASENYETYYKIDELKSYLNEEKRIEKQLEAKRQRLEKLNNIIDEFDLEKLNDEKNKKIYDQTVYEIHRLEGQMRVLRTELEEKANRRIEFMKKQDTGITGETFIEEIDFYDWVAGIFNIEARFIEFWLSVFPAVFIDIIAPLAVAVGMFLNRRRKEEKNESI